jgi:hypothetical protein
MRPPRATLPASGDLGALAGRGADAAKAALPWRGSTARWRKVSTLFDQGGQALIALLGGDGGLRRGMPRRPSIDSSIAVSSPQRRRLRPEDLEVEAEAGASMSAPSRPARGRRAAPRAGGRPRRGFGADVEEAAPGATANAAIAIPSITRNGNDSISIRSMNARGRPRAVADDELGGGLLLWTIRHLRAVGKPAPRGRAAAALDLVDHLAGVRSRALAQRGEPAVGEVLVEVQRVEAAEVLGGDVALAAEERGDVGAGVVGGAARGGGVAAVAAASQSMAAWRRGGATERGAGLEVAPQQRARRPPGEFGELERGAAGQGDFDQRRAVAHHDAADALDGGGQACRWRPPVGSPRGCGRSRGRVQHESRQMRTSPAGWRGGAGRRGGARCGGGLRRAGTRRSSAAPSRGSGGRASGRRSGRPGRACSNRRRTPSRR